MGAGRGEGTSTPRLSMSAASLGGLNRERHIGNRSIAAVVLKIFTKTSARKKRRKYLRLEVVWSTVNRDEADPFLLTRGVIEEREEAEIFNFEAFRMPWEEEERRRPAVREIVG